MRKVFAAALILTALGVDIPSPKKKVVKKKRKKKKALPKAKEQKALPEAVEYPPVEPWASSPAEPTQKNDLQAQSPRTVVLEDSDAQEGPRFGVWPFPEFEFIGRLGDRDVWLVGKKTIRLVSGNNWSQRTLQDSKQATYCIWETAARLVEKYLAKKGFKPWPKSLVPKYNEPGDGVFLGCVKHFCAKDYDVWFVPADASRYDWVRLRWGDLPTNYSTCRMEAIKELARKNPIWKKAAKLIEDYLTKEEKPLNLKDCEEAPDWIEAPRNRTDGSGRADMNFLAISKTRVDTYKEPRPGNGIWRICQSTNRISSGENLTHYRKQDDGTYKKIEKEKAT